MNASSISCSLGFPDSSLSLRIDMTELQYTLLSDGSSDRVLMPILTWLLHQLLPNCPVQSRWADLRRLPNCPRKLCDRIRTTADLYGPCDLLFVHRDAETASMDQRRGEIHDAIRRAWPDGNPLPAIAVIPVRMMEAWLLFNETAIRQAAGNPNGTVILSMPRLIDVEDIPDPKDVLHNLVLAATDLPMRRRKRFDVNKAVPLIPKYIDDFSPLKNLLAFSSLENQVVQTITDRRWHECSSERTI